MTLDCRVLRLESLIGYLSYNILAKVTDRHSHRVSESDGCTASFQKADKQAVSM